MNPWPLFIIGMCLTWGSILVPHFDPSNSIGVGGAVLLALFLSVFTHKTK